VRELSFEAVQSLRLSGQRLGARRRRGSVQRVVADVFALQAQDDFAATLGIWARSDGLTAADVAKARDVDGSVVRVWCLRGTLHLVSAADVRWLLDVLRPIFVKKNRTRRLQLGLDDETTARGVQAVVAMLADGPRTRAEIADRLAHDGIPSKGQATIHILWRAALDGLVCYGPDRDGSETLVLLDDWLKPGPIGDRDRNLTQLAQRYLQAYAPTRPEDFAAWSGLGLTDARHAWQQLGAAVQQVATPSGTMWLPAKAKPFPPAQAAPVRLLPAFDGLWLGYRDGFAALSPAQRQQIYPGGGVIRPSVLLDGRPVGTWTRRARSKDIEVSVDLFTELSPEAHVALKIAVTDLASFLGRPARLSRM
jgi:hypothetical protein